MLARLTFWFFAVWKCFTLLKGGSNPNPRLIIHCSLPLGILIGPRILHSLHGGVQPVPQIIQSLDSLDTFSIETLTWKCRISHVPRLRELASPAIKNHHAAIQAQLKIIQIGGNLSFPKRKDSIGDQAAMIVDDVEI